MKTIIFLLSFVLWATCFATEKSTNCLVTIEYSKKTGEVEKKDYSYTTKNKAACKKIADNHRENFTPQIVNKKKVNFVWRGGK